MPIRSKAQHRFMRAAEARGELPKGTTGRWVAHTPGGLRGLPQRLKKKIKRKRRGAKKS